MKQKQSRPPYAIYFMLFGLVLIWGANFSLVKMALAEFSILPFTVIRYSLGALLVLSFLLIKEGWEPVPVMDLLKIASLGVLGHAVYQLLFVNGLKATTAGNSSIFIATVPVWTALLSFVFSKDRLTKLAWLGIFIAFAGSVVVIFGSGQKIELLGSQNLGNILVLSAAILLSTYTVFSRDLLKKYSPLRFTALTMTTGLMGLWIVGGPAVFNENWGAISWQGWAVLLYSGIFALACGYLVWFTGIKKIGPARTAVFDNLTPVIAFLVAFFLLGEQVVWMQGLGGGAVIYGVFLTIRH